MYNEIDKKYLDYLNSTREKSDLASLLDDKPYVSDMYRAQVEADDDLSNKLFDVDNGRAFTTWITTLSTSNSIRKSGFRFKRR